MSELGGGVCALALHHAQKFLTDKNRRVLEVSGDFAYFTRIVLGNDFDRYTHDAAAELEKGPPESFLFFHDADYPPLLKEINYAPFALYLKGNRTILKNEFVSIVGTREPSAKGRRAAANLAAIFSHQQKIIVSGIARGVDAIAHHSAVAAAGSTIAILPNGFNHVYPLENRDLYAAAAHSSILLLSEYAPEQKPQRHHFIRRNRIIAGLSPLTIFVEGDVKSGGMITVKHALDEGRDVAALSHAQLLNNSGGEKLVGEGALNFTDLAFSREVRPVSL